MFVIRAFRLPQIAMMAIAILVVSCSREAAATKDGSPPTGRTRLEVGVYPYLSYAPLYIALENGYFAEEGLDVHFTVVRDVSSGQNALAAGDLDVLATMLSTAMFNAINRGVAIRIVADKGNGEKRGCASFAFVARSDLLDSGRLKTPSDLRGMTITDQRDSIPGYATDVLLERGGLRQSDVNLVRISPQGAPGAFADHQIDVASSAEPWTSLIVEKRLGRVWMDFSDVVPDGSWAFILYGERLLERDRDAGRRFMAAYLRGVRQYNEGKTDRNIAITARFTGLDEATVRRSCWMPISADGSLHTAGIQSYLEWANRRGYLDSVPSLDRYWDPEFIEWVAANRPEIERPR